MSIAAVILRDVKLIWLIHVGLFFNRCIYIHNENLPNQFVPLSKVSTVINFYNHGDLENTVMVKLMNAIKGLLIMYLGYRYQVCTLNGY